MQPIRFIKSNAVFNVFNHQAMEVKTHSTREIYNRLVISVCEQSKHLNFLLQ